MKFEYIVRLIDGKSLRGSRELEPGENIIKLSLPEGVLEKPRAAWSLSWRMGKSSSSTATRHGVIARSTTRTAG